MERYTIINYLLISEYLLSELCKYFECGKLTCVYKKKKNPKCCDKNWPRNINTIESVFLTNHAYLVALRRTGSEEYKCVFVCVYRAEAA